MKRDKILNGIKDGLASTACFEIAGCEPSRFMRREKQVPSQDSLDALGPAVDLLLKARAEKQAEWSLKIPFGKGDIEFLTNYNSKREIRSRSWMTYAEYADDDTVTYITTLYWF